MGQTPNTLRVFISYSRKDLSIAEGLREGLVDRGIEAFLDVHDIAPGEDWKDRLRV
ncbi:MAG: toll/interleukin-1 receptor domain-containing protein [Pseudomonadota bacterium]